MFFSWLKQKKSSLVGIHFDIASIKLVELTHSSNGYQLNCFIHLPIPRDMQPLNSESKILPELAELIKQKGLKTTETICAIRNNIVLSKIKFIDAGLTDKEVRTYVMRQVEAQLGNGINDYCIDYTIFPQTQAATDLICIRWAIAKRQDIETYSTFLNKLALTPRAIEVDAFALQRAGSLLASQVTNNNALVLVQINIDSLIVQILQNNQLLFMDEARIFSHDNNSITKIIMRLMQIFMNSSSIQLEKIFLAGERANPQLVSLLRNNFTGEVCLTNFSGQLRYAADINQQQFNMICPDFLVCCGLAMWEGGQ